MALLLDAILTIIVWLFVTQLDTYLLHLPIKKVYSWFFGNAVVPIWGNFLFAAILFLLGMILIYPAMAQEVKLAVRAKADRRPHFLKRIIYFIDEMLGNKGEKWPSFFLVPATILHLFAILLVFHNPSYIRADVWCAILVGLLGVWGLYRSGLPPSPARPVPTQEKEPEAGEPPVEASANKVGQFSFVDSVWNQEWFHNQIVFQLPWPTSALPVDADQDWRSAIERFQAREDSFDTGVQHKLFKESKPLETILDQLKTGPRPEGKLKLFSHQAKVLDVLEGSSTTNGQPNHVLLSTPVGSGNTTIDLVAALYKIFCKHQTVLMVLPTVRLGQLAAEELKQAFLDSHWDWSVSFVVFWSTDPEPKVIHRRNLPYPVYAAPDILIVDLENLYDQLLSGHQKWQYFFEQLGLVIVENLEAYTGILGANASMVFSRLMRLAKHYHSKPQILAHMVKIEAEEPFFEQFFGLKPDDFSTMNIVDEDGRSTKAKQVIFWNPEMSHVKLQDAIELTRASYLEDMLKILSMLGKAYSKSVVLHKTVTLCDADITATNQGVITEFQSKQRRELDVSTGSAMEIVFDQRNSPRLAIPETFDSAIVSGIPGSFMNIMHDLEHIGNASQWDSQPLIVMLPDNPLAQYLSRHATQIVHTRQNPIENLLPITNPFVQAKHILGALAELPATREEIDSWFGEQGQEILDRFCEKGKIRTTDTPILDDRGRIVLDNEGNPRMTNRYELVDRDEYQPSSLSGLGEKIWKLRVDDLEKALLVGDTIGWDIYPYATWVYANQRFRIKSVDLIQKVVSATNISTPLSSERILKVEFEFLSGNFQPDQSNLPVHLKPGYESIDYLEVGQMEILQHSPLWTRVSEKIIGYREYTDFTYDKGRRHKQSSEVDRPPFWTRAFIVGIPDADSKVMHTLTHLIRATLPLFLHGDLLYEVIELDKCKHVEDHPALVIYDAIAGGTGVAEWFGRGNNFQKVLASALDMLESCSCEIGCCGCTSIHDCHIPNTDGTTCELDKIGTIRLLAVILGKDVDALIKHRTEVIELAEDIYPLVRHLVDFVFPHKLGLEIVEPAHIQVNPKLDKRYNGLYFSDKNEVWVRPLKEMDMIMVLAHEYAHNWQGRGKDPMNPDLMKVPYFEGKLFLEGFAQWVEYKVADYYGFRLEMDQIHFAHYNEYAEGFQVLRWIEDTVGAGKVMEFIRTGKLIMNNQEIPVQTMLDRSGVLARLSDWENRFKTTPPDNDVDVTVDEIEEENVITNPEDEPSSETSESSVTDNKKDTHKYTKEKSVKETNTGLKE